MYPSLRLLIALVVGIIIGDNYVYQGDAFVFLSIFALLIILLFIFSVFRQGVLFGVVSMLLFSLFGYFSMSMRMSESELTIDGHRRVHILEITSSCEEKKSTYMYDAKLLSIRDSLGDYRSLDKEELIVLYLRKDSLSKSLKPGDIISVYSNLQSFITLGDFDYPKFMKRRGYYCSLYAPRRWWKKVDSIEVSDLCVKAENWRGSILDYYKALGFQGEELAILSAITLGEKGGIDKEMRNNYAVAGVSHILALSGLHVGLIVGLLVSIFRPIWKRWRVLRFSLYTLIVFFLWAYVVLTGLSPSVVRAALMFTMFILSDLLYRDVFSVNSLIASAFIMLLVSPWWLFEVGFQLSVISVFFILILQPRLYKLYKPRTRIGKWGWGLMSVTLSAQLGTTPLVAYYFQILPIHFIWANLVVIPLTTSVIYLSIPMLIFFFYLPLADKLASLVAYLINLQNDLLSLISHLPYSSLRVVIDFWELSLLLLSVLAILATLVYRRFSLLAASILFLSAYLLYEPIRCYLLL